ncbi:MAG: TonB-dependent receptor [Pseudomonadota bacterium]
MQEANPFSSARTGRGCTTSLSVAVGAALLINHGAVLAQEDDDEDHRPIDEIEVVATLLDNTIDEIGQGVTVLEGDELERLRTNTIGEMLALTPGVTASDFGAGASRPVIRGLGGPRVRVQEDGISTLDVSTVSVDHAVALEPLLVERVEVLRGPATLAYGSGAVGGVVNTITTRLPTEIPDGLEGRFRLGGNTVANEQSAALALRGGIGQIVLQVDASIRDQDDYDIPGVAITLEDFEEEQERGTVANSALESSAFGGGLSWIGERGYFGVNVSTFETTYGVPTIEEEEEEEGEEGEEEEGEEGISIDLEQTRIDFKAGIEPASGFLSKIELRGAYNDYDHVELEGEEIGTTFANEAFEARLDIAHQPIGDWVGSFGVQFATAEFSAIGAEAFVPPVDTTSVGVYLIEELDLDDWFFSIGGRFETQDQEPVAGGSVDDTAFSVSASAIRTFAERHRIGLTLNRAQRLPSAEELFSDGPHLATSTFEIGDATLDVETSNHAELSWRYSGERVGFSATGYVTDFEDFIFLAETDDIEDGLPVFLWTQADADFVGFEAEFSATLAEFSQGGDLDLSLFADVVSGELSGGGNLPRISPARVGGRLEYHDRRLTTGFDIAQIFDQDDVAEFETETDGYTMLNADISLVLAEDALVPVEVFVRASNLLDEDARRHTSFVKDLAPLPGRNYTIGLRGRF